MKKNKKNKKKLTFKRIMKLTLRNTIYLIVAIAYLIYLLFKTINKLVVKAFNKLPKALKIALIYTLIIGNLPNLMTIYKVIDNLKIDTKELATQVAIIEKVETIEKNEIVETTEIIEIVEETKEENTCYLSTEIECKIYNKAIENEMTHEQAILLVAISKHETGNWTSYNFKNKNNLGGLYNGKEGTFYSYETLEKGIEAFVNLLKNRYFGKGLNTIEEIGNVYCPVGAKNDPNGLNKNWIPKVSQYYNNYLGK